MAEKLQIYTGWDEAVDAADEINRRISIVKTRKSSAGVQMKNKAPVYENGLAFECTACGKCCVNHSDYTEVYLTTQDLKNISKFLGLKKKPIYEKIHRDGWRSYLAVREYRILCIF